MENKVSAIFNKRKWKFYCGFGITNRKKRFGFVIDNMPGSKGEEYKYFISQNVPFIHELFGDGSSEGEKECRKTLAKTKKEKINELTRYMKKWENDIKYYRTLDAEINNDVVTNTMTELTNFREEYFKRLIFVIKTQLKEVANKEKVHCSLVAIIADDINPEVVTVQLGFTILLLKLKQEKEARLYIDKEVYVEFNEGVLLKCYEQLALMGNDSKGQEYLGENKSEGIKSVIENKTKEKETKHEDGKISITAERENRELENSHLKIKHLSRTIRTLKQGLTENELFKILQETRKKNGNPNYSAIGRIIGCTNHTAKAKCKYFNLK
ncbi:MAG: hypothetical protein PF445_03190 [Melioribacteraceae bacterium]|jgi:hypothetical protein|nr:hypothetical protein [Melioribacteraceae bacterium]